jgi:hypothetical protein
MIESNQLTIPIALSCHCAWVIIHTSFGAPGVMLLAIVPLMQGVAVYWTIYPIGEGYPTYATFCRRRWGFYSHEISIRDCIKTSYPRSDSLLLRTLSNALLERGMHSIISPLDAANRISLNTFSS